MKSRIPCSAKTGRDRTGVRGEAGVVGVHGRETQSGTTARARIGQRIDAIVYLDCLHHDRSSSADATAHAGYRHLIARTRACARRTQHYLAAFARLRAAVAATYVYGAACGQIQLAFGGADFHFAAFLTTTC